MHSEIFEQVREIAEKELWPFVKSRRAMANSDSIDGAEALSDRIWEPFERRAQVLDHFGYIDVVSENRYDERQVARPTSASTGRCLSVKL